MSGPRYPNSLGAPAAVAPVLRRLLRYGAHQFWRDNLSLLDESVVDAERLLSSRQVTDTYLLALARAHGGRLATFDVRLVAQAVPGGAQALHVL